LPYHHAPPRSAVSRITAILTTFRAGGSHSITEIARLTGLPVSTTHRFLNDLAAWQLLVRKPDGQFRIGPVIRQLGSAPAVEPLLRDRAPQVVTDLSDATHRRARLGVLAPGAIQPSRVAYIEKSALSEPATSFTDGATLPAHATALGKALLAFAPPSVVAAVTQHLTAYTPRTLDTPERLHSALRVVRLTLSATACGELMPHESAVAAPVFGCGGVVVAALELEVLHLHTDLEVARTALAVAARGLSRELVTDHDRSGYGHLKSVSAAAGS
jgi:DNA-binding IclR family transcriptional regulator